MRALRSITLIAIDTVDANRASKVLTYCSRLFEFGRVVLFSNAVPTIPFEHDVQKVAKLDFAGVQRWELSELKNAFQTDFCLNVQHDGWILNPHLWTDDFLKWDYIGAPWPRTWCLRRVGNSGFSLRSQAFCQASAEVAPAYSDEGYDVFVCRVAHQRFLQRGIKYAPVTIAGAFSWEHDCDDVVSGPETSFGFHGWVNDRTPEHYRPMLDRLS